MKAVFDYSLLSVRHLVIAPTPNSAPTYVSNGTAGQVSVSGMRTSWTDVRIDGMDVSSTAIEDTQQVANLA